MSDYLRLTIVLDGSEAELSAEFRSGFFSGRGSAYFDQSFLLAQGESFSQFPLMTGAPPCIEGGYLDPDNLDKIAQEHVHLSAHPVDRTGSIGLRVRVGEPSEEASRSQLLCCASTEFKITYEQLKQLSNGLISLANGDTAIFEIRL